MSCLDSKLETGNKKKHGTVTKRTTCVADCLLADNQSLILFGDGWFRSFVRSVRLAGRLKRDADTMEAGQQLKNCDIL